MANAETLEMELAEKVKKYRSLTEEALEKVLISAEKGSHEFKVAQDFLQMAKNYFSDAKHFEEKRELLTALAAYSYAHAWLDAGIRARVLDGKNDERLFTLP
ncbi:MAG: DUF357 domain-containing protein [Candidatus Diapherotrites archaeon]